MDTQLPIFARVARICSYWSESHSDPFQVCVPLDSGTASCFLLVYANTSYMYRHQKSHAIDLLVVQPR